jgi:hypothetical protein
MGESREQVGNRPVAGLLTDDELRQLVDRQRARIAAEQAFYFELVREVDRRPWLVPGARPGAESQTFLRALRVTDPAADLRVARALGDDLPELGKALAVGEVSRGHVEVAERTIRTIKKNRTAAQPLDAADIGRIDSWVTEAARDLSPRELRTAARRLETVLSPDEADTVDPHLLERREFLTWDDPSGLIGVSGLLDHATGAWLRAALDHWSKPNPMCAPDPDDGQDTLPIRDTRTKRQRQADALHLICRLALAGASTATEAARPHVVIHVRKDSPIPMAECDQTGPVSSSWVERHLCDAVLEQVTLGRNREVLEIGRTARTATGPLRRALIARDRTCVIPNCTIPAAWCDAHHVRWWSQDGPTNASNLAMVCGPHHTQIHGGTWSLEMRNGVPWSQPPRWLDPHQRWRRNTYQHHRESAEQLGMNLADPNDTS